MHRWIPLAVASASVMFAEPAASQQDPALMAQGAQVYLSTCGRCHNARPASERTDREWMAIIAHMRARANLSRSNALAVLAFLTATNVPENATANAGAEVSLPASGPPGGPSGDGAPATGSTDDPQASRSCKRPNGETRRAPLHGSNGG